MKKKFEVGNEDLLWEKKKEKKKKKELKVDWIDEEYT